MKPLFHHASCLTAAAGALLLSATACQQEEEFADSIFDTTISTVDQSATTAPFDQWLYENFVVPYNTEIQYRFNFTASDINYQLSPADYKKSQLLARFIKYLFYDVYDKYGEHDANGNALFMKKYAPRIFHFIGSDAYSPTTNTETLGYASAGVKITLIGVNNMRTVMPDMDFTAEDMDHLNEKQFHTMHHEFSHILQQTKVTPTTFALVTPGTYDPRSWHERDSTLTHQMGYLTHYASSASYEDFVETLSCTITDTDYRWMTTIIDATLNGGVKTGDKEQIYDLLNKLEIANCQDPDITTFSDTIHHWNNFSIYSEFKYDEESKQYKPTDRYVLDVHREDAISQYKAANGQIYNQIGQAIVPLKYELERSFTSFYDYMNTWVKEDNSTSHGGINAILKKIEIASRWYTEAWGLDLFTMRREVRHRQDHINEFYHSDQCVIYDYQ